MLDVVEIAEHERGIRVEAAGDDVFRVLERQTVALFAVECDCSDKPQPPEKKTTDVREGKGSKGGSCYQG